MVEELRPSRRFYFGGEVGFLLLDALTQRVAAERGELDRRADVLGGKPFGVTGAFREQGGAFNFSGGTSVSSGSFMFDLTDVIRTGSFASVGELVRDIEAYLDDRNANPRPYRWQAKGEAILGKIRRARTALEKASAA